MSAREIVAADGIDVFYGTSQILFGVSISVTEGQTMALLGRNGAGKSTTMKALAGIAPPSKGVVRVLGKAVQGAKPHLIARAGLGFVPEDRQVFPEHTVEDNLLIAAKKGPDGQDYWNLARIFEMLPLLAPLKDRMAGNLSGGEQQMLTIARTLMGNPSLILLDEPSEGLAPLIVREVMNIVLELTATNLTTVLVEQNAMLALRVCKRVYVLDDGKNVHEGTAEEMLADDQLKRQLIGI